MGGVRFEGPVRLVARHAAGTPHGSSWHIEGLHVPKSVPCARGENKTTKAELKMSFRLNSSQLPKTPFRPIENAIELIPEETTQVHPIVGSLRLGSLLGGGGGGGGEPAIILALMCRGPRPCGATLKAFALYPKP